MQTLYFADVKSHFYALHSIFGLVLFIVQSNPDQVRLSLV